MNAEQPKTVLVELDSVDALVVAQALHLAAGALAHGVNVLDNDMDSTEQSIAIAHATDQMIRAVGIQGAGRSPEKVEADIQETVEAYPGGPEAYAEQMERREKRCASPMWAKL